MSKTQDAFHNWLAQQGPLDSVQFWHCWKAASELSAQRIAELEAEVARLSGELSLSNRTGDHLGMRVRDLKAEVASLRVDAERYAFIRAGKVDIVEMRGWIAIGTGDSDWCAYSDAEFDAAIDAARGVK